MTEQELDVIEAAVEVSGWQRALDAGNPALRVLARAVERLTVAVAALETEHDGRWRRPE